jgi:hypothetical protein
MVGMGKKKGCLTDIWKRPKMPEILEMPKYTHKGSSASQPERSF